MRNEEECVCSVCLFRCNIFIGVRIIKEMPGSVVSGTPCTLCELLVPKGTATLEPEPTQHSKPTFVWVYIAGTCGYIQTDNRFVHCNDTRILCALQQVSAQTFGSKQTHCILKVWDSHKTQLYCSQIGLRFLLIYWFDNMFRPLHLGHHQVYKMFIRVQVNYCLL